jgi:hypothetical protein
MNAYKEQITVAPMLSVPTLQAASLARAIVGLAATELLAQVLPLFYLLSFFYL